MQLKFVDVVLVHGIPAFDEHVAARDFFEHLVVHALGPDQHPYQVYFRILRGLLVDQVLTFNQIRIREEMGDH